MVHITASCGTVVPYCFTSAVRHSFITHKTKGTFWGAEGAIQTYHSLPDQLDPFWLLLESHVREPLEPCIHVSGSPKDPKWLPRRPPLNTEVWLPPESHFGSSSIISDGSPLCSIITFLQLYQQQYVISYFLCSSVKAVLYSSE